MRSRSPPVPTQFSRNRLFTPVFGQEFTFQKFFSAAFRNPWRLRELNSRLFFFLGEGLSTNKFSPSRTRTSEVDASGLFSTHSRSAGPDNATQRQVLRTYLYYVLIVQLLSIDKFWRIIYRGQTGVAVNDRPAFETHGVG